MKKFILCAPLCLLALTGCLLPTKRKLPIPKAPDVVKTASADELVGLLNGRWKTFNSLIATVEIKASALKSKEGVVKDYPSFQAQILMRNPGDLRVLGKVPIVKTKMFDLASVGDNFLIYIPPYSKAVRGSNKMHKRSTALYENLRPNMFFDAMIVRGLEPHDLYAITADTETIEDPTRKHLYETPEYVLSIMRPKSGSQELEPVRIVIFHREDLLPYEQDLYDMDGNLETQVFYSQYIKTNNNYYPSVVTIKRPIEEYQLILTVDKVDESMQLKDDQFQIKVPAEIKVQDLETLPEESSKPGSVTPSN